MTAFVEGAHYERARESAWVACVCQMEPRGQPMRTSVFRE